MSSPIDDNPYTAPAAHPSQIDDRTIAKARLLMARREQLPTVGYYLQQQWKRHLLMAVAFGVLTWAAWQSRNVMLATFLLAFWSGRFIRDLQWYRALCREWDSTRELIDWQRVQLLAESGHK